MSTAGEACTWASLPMEIKRKIIEEALGVGSSSCGSYVTFANVGEHMSRLLPLLVTNKQTSDIATSVFHDKATATFQVVAEGSQAEVEDECHSYAQNSSWKLSRGRVASNVCMLPQSVRSKARQLCIIVRVHILYLPRYPLPPHLNRAGLLASWKFPKLQSVQLMLRPCRISHGRETAPHLAAGFQHFRETHRFPFKIIHMSIFREDSPSTEFEEYLYNAPKTREL